MRRIKRKRACSHSFYVSAGADTACGLDYTPYNIVAEGYGAAGLEVKSAKEGVKEPKKAN